MGIAAAQLSHCEVLDYALFSLVQSVMPAVERLLDCLELDLLATRALLPMEARGASRGTCELPDIRSTQAKAFAGARSRAWLQRLLEEEAVLPRFCEESRSLLFHRGRLRPALPESRAAAAADKTRAGAARS
jgi:hypothetical protein